MFNMRHTLQIPNMQVSSFSVGCLMQGESAELGKLAGCTDGALASRKRMLPSGWNTAERLEGTVEHDVVNKKVR